MFQVYRWMINFTWTDWWSLTDVLTLQMTHQLCDLNGLWANSTDKIYLDELLTSHAYIALIKFTWTGCGFTYLALIKALIKFTWLGCGLVMYLAIIKALIKFTWMGCGLVKYMALITFTWMGCGLVRYLAIIKALIKFTWMGCGLVKYMALIKVTWMGCGLVMSVPLIKFTWMGCGSLTCMLRSIKTWGIKSGTSYGCAWTQALSPSTPACRLISFSRESGSVAAWRFFSFTRLRCSKWLCRTWATFQLEKASKQHLHICATRVQTSQPLSPSPSLSLTPLLKRLKNTNNKREFVSAFRDSKCSKTQLKKNMQCTNTHLQINSI